MECHVPPPGNCRKPPSAAVGSRSVGRVHLALSVNSRYFKTLALGTVAVVTVHISSALLSPLTPRAFGAPSPSLPQSSSVSGVTQPAVALGSSVFTEGEVCLFIRVAPASAARELGAALSLHSGGAQRVRRRKGGRGCRDESL